MHLPTMVFLVIPPTLPLHMNGIVDEMARTTPPVLTRGVVTSNDPSILLGLALWCSYFALVFHTSQAGT